MASFRGKQTMGDALWDAWACLCSSGTHLKVCCVLSNPSYCDFIPVQASWSDPTPDDIQYQYVVYKYKLI